MKITITMIIMVMMMKSTDNTNDEIFILMYVRLSSYHMCKMSQVRNNAIICDDAQVLSITGHDRYYCASACKNLK